MKTKLWLIIALMPNGIIPSGDQYSQRKATGGLGGVNIYSDPIDMGPYGGGWYDPSKGWQNLNGTPQIQDPTKFNPFTMGYVSNGQWNPYPQYLPDKIIPSQRTITPEQTVGAAQYFVNGQTATRGQPQAQKPFTVEAPSTSTRTQSYGNPNFSGFMAGNNGSLGKLAGVFGNNVPGQNTPFYQQEPISATQGNTNPLLGTFTKWSPSLAALQQSR